MRTGSSCPIRGEIDARGEYRGRKKKTALLLSFHLRRTLHTYTHISRMRCTIFSARLYLKAFPVTLVSPRESEYVQCSVIHRVNTRLCEKQETGEYGQSRFNLQPLFRLVRRILRNETLVRRARGWQLWQRQAAWHDPVRGVVNQGREGRWVDRVLRAYFPRRRRKYIRAANNSLPTFCCFASC